MPKYKIPIRWEMWGDVNVEAEDLHEALNNAIDAELPENGEYIDYTTDVFEEHLYEGSGYGRMSGGRQFREYRNISDLVCDMDALEKDAVMERGMTPLEVKHFMHNAKQILRDLHGQK